MQPSIWQILIVAALVLILFGRGRISEMMGDVGKGIRSFKKGINDDQAQIDDKAGDVGAESTTDKDKSAG